MKFIIFLIAILTLTGCRVSEQKQLAKEIPAPTLAKEVKVEIAETAKQVDQAKVEVGAITVTAPTDIQHKANAIFILGDVSDNLAGIGDKADVLADKTEKQQKENDKLKDAESKKWQVWGWALIAGGIAALIGSFWLGSIFRWAGGIALAIGLAFKAIGDHYSAISKTIDIALTVVVLAALVFAGLFVWQLIYFKRKGLTRKAAFAQVVLNVKELDPNPTDDVIEVKK